MIHRTTILIAAIFAVMFGPTANAQRNVAVDLLDSPVKIDGEVYNAAGPPILCSAAIPGGAGLFGADTVAANRYTFNELFGAFRTWETDPTCALNLTWSTAFAGTTQTGLAIANGDTAHYWAVNPASQTIDQYHYGVGTATGTSTALPVGGLWGSAVVDDNQPGQVTCVNDIVADAYTCIDLTTGSVICSFAIAGGTGSGAFGNGNGDATTPSDCSGQTLVQASGTIGEGQVTRVGQYDCSGADPLCTDRWDVSTFSTFTNGIDETDIGGVRSLFMCDNAGANIFILRDAGSINACQGVDPNMKLMYVNGLQGVGPRFNVDVSVSSTLAVGMQQTPAGNGKFVAHMYPGSPGVGTIVALLDLGCACFDFRIAAEVVNHNNIGRTRFVGVSNYFGTAISDPAKAPTFLSGLLQPSIDSANLAVGTVWTHQSIHLNSASSSKKGASLSNAVQMSIVP